MMASPLELFATPSNEEVSVTSEIFDLPLFSARSFSTRSSSAVVGCITMGPLGGPSPFFAAGSSSFFVFRGFFFLFERFPTNVEIEDGSWSSQCLGKNSLNVSLADSITLLIGGVTGCCGFLFFGGDFLCDRFRRLLHGDFVGVAHDINVERRLVFLSSSLFS
jgi:hypothetical protein